MKTKLQLVAITIVLTASGCERAELPTAVITHPPHRNGIAIEAPRLVAAGLTSIATSDWIAATIGCLGCPHDQNWPCWEAGNQ